MIRIRTTLLTTHLIFRLTAVALAAIVFAAPVSAALIMDSLHYDARVSNGTTTGIEKHFKDFSPNMVPTAFDDLPADNSMLAGLTNGNNLTVNITEFMDALNGNIMRHSVIEINRPGTGDIFANSYDPAFPLPITFDGLFFSNSIGANQFVAINSIQLEQIPAAGTPPFPSPSSPLITGLGTQANPLRIKFDISANQVANRRGALKVHLYHSLEPIPEPASVALIVCGLVAIAGLSRRR